MTPVVTLTLNPAVDLSSSAEAVVPEHKIRCGVPRLDPGGGGINVARAVRALGGDALAVHTAGGPIGELLEELLAAEGVAHRAVRTRELTRQSFTVVETRSAREFRFVLPGPELSRGEWRACLDAVAAVEPAPRYLVASGSMPPGVPDGFYEELASTARARGARLVLDTSGEPLRRALGRGVYLIKPNRRELEELTGRDLARHGAQEQACRELVSSGAAEAVALTLGAEGGLLVWAGGALRVRPPEVEVRSSVGAGDSTVAGMVLALVRGLALPEAFCFGIAAGTAALLTPGTELCRREDAERLHHLMYVRDGPSATPAEGPVS